MRSQIIMAPRIIMTPQIIMAPRIIMTPRIIMAPLRSVTFLFVTLFSAFCFGELTPHQFLGYPSNLIYKLHQKLKTENLTQENLEIFNCDGCPQMVLPDYVIKGFKRLIEISPDEMTNQDDFSAYKQASNQVNTQVKKRNTSLREGELAIVVDYHFNFVHLFTYTKGAQGQKTVWIQKSYPASNGIGGLTSKKKSGGTPSGVHFIYAKQHPHAKESEIVWAKPYDLVGQVVTSTQADQWWEPRIITSRRVRLAGLEKHNQTSKARAILFHGTVEEGYIGMQKSGGCIRMKNKDVMELFDDVEIGTLVNIVGDTKKVAKENRQGIIANNRPFLRKGYQNCEDNTHFYTLNQVRRVLRGQEKFKDHVCD